MFKEKPWNILLILALLLLPLYIKETLKITADEAETLAEPVKEEISPVKTVFVVPTDVPDFSSITNTQEKKSVFFNHFYSLLVVENSKILAERALLQSSAPDEVQLQRLCNKYASQCDVIDADKIEQLLRRVDLIPPALVLAQAAKESGWGGSRFAREANNYFGQWCYSKGCGLVPSSRIEGASHEVRKFKSAQDSVRAYLFNLNTGKAYEDLRTMRAENRQLGEHFYGHDLAASLLYYSERREAYVEELQSFIRYNKLQAFDEAFWNDLNQ